MSVIHRWLDTDGKNIDKAFGKPPGPPPSAEPDVLPEKPQPDAEDDESGVPDEFKDLRAALLEYQKLSIDPRLDLDVDRCTWEDVFECMTGAEEDYEKKAKSWRGVGRRLLRKAGDRAEDVDPWLKLIPPEYGMGIIGAGVSIMFMLARNASQNREKILDAFQEIPIIVASAKAKLRAFPDNRELVSCNKKLNLEIILAVSKLVGALLPEKHAERVPYFWSRSKLGKSSIDDVLKSLRDQADQLKRLVQDFVDEAIGEIQRTTTAIKEDTTYLKSTASKIQRNTTELKRDASDIKTRASGIQRDMSTLISQASGIQVQVTHLKDEVTSDYQKRLQIYEREKEVSEKKKEEAEKSRNLMAQILEEVVAESQRNAQENERLRAEIEYMRARTPVSSFMTAEQFLAAIGASTLIHQSTEDIDKVLRLQGSIHHIAEAEAVSLLRTDTFRAWLQPARSDAILVDGAGAAVEFSHHPERVSAKSVLCASLLATLGRSQKETFQLFFFAGLHSSEKDPSSDGPRGMIRSLLCELVKEAHRRGWLYLDFIDDKTYRDEIKSQNIRYLCDAFYRILQRLQMQDAIDLSVYCVVDGIAQYEQQRWYSDLGVVIQMFRMVVNDTKLKPAFKLLLTGPHRVRYVHDWLGLPCDKRLSTNAFIGGENLGTPLLSLGVEQALQARRQQNLAERRGRSQYLDDMEMTEGDYE